MNEQIADKMLENQVHFNKEELNFIRKYGEKLVQEVLKAVDNCADTDFNNRFYMTFDRVKYLKLKKKAGGINEQK